MTEAFEEVSTRTQADGCGERTGLGFCPQQMPAPAEYGHAYCYYHRKVRAGLLQPALRLGEQGRRAAA